MPSGVRATEVTHPPPASAQDCKTRIYVLSFLNKGHVAKATRVIQYEEVGYLNSCCENTETEKPFYDHNFNASSVK